MKISAMRNPFQNSMVNPFMNLAINPGNKFQAILEKPWLPEARAAFEARLQRSAQDVLSLSKLEIGLRSPRRSGEIRPARSMGRSSGTPLLQSTRKLSRRVGGSVPAED